MVCMTSISHVAAKPAVAAAVTSTTEAATSDAAAVSLPKPKAAAAPSAGPAAIIQLSDKARAKLLDDKDWVPGTKVDNH
jgi:hypothetical protein